RSHHSALARRLRTAHRLTTPGCHGVATWAHERHGDDRHAWSGLTTPHGGSADRFPGPQLARRKPAFGTNRRTNAVACLTGAGQPGENLDLGAVGQKGLPVRAQIVSQDHTCRTASPRLDVDAVPDCEDRTVPAGRKRRTKRRVIPHNTSALWRGLQHTPTARRPLARGGPGKDGEEWTFGRVHPSVGRYPSPKHTCCQSS